MPRLPSQTLNLTLPQNLPWLHPLFLLQTPRRRMMSFPSPLLNLTQPQQQYHNSTRTQLLLSSLPRTIQPWPATLIRPTASAFIVPVLPALLALRLPLPLPLHKLRLPILPTLMDTIYNRRRRHRLFQPPKLLPYPLLCRPTRTIPYPPRL